MIQTKHIQVLDLAKVQTLFELRICREKKNKLLLI